MSIFLNDFLLRYYVFSFLPACDIFHRISVLNKNTRTKLPGAGLLTQQKVIALKSLHAHKHLDIALNSFNYALSITDGILVQLNFETIKKLQDFIDYTLNTTSIRFHFIDFIVRLTERRFISTAFTLLMRMIIANKGFYIRKLTFEVNEQGST